MRSIAIIAAALASAALVAGCSAQHDAESGETVTKTIAVGDFHKIALAGSHDVTVRTGSKPSVRIEGPERAVERLEAEVEGDELRIHSRKGSSFTWSNSPKLRIEVTVPALEEATVAGSGRLAIDRVAGQAFKGSIAGSAELAIAELETRTVELNIAGSGHASVHGRTGRADYTVAGSGDLDAANLASRDVELTIAGSGNVTAQASGAVTGDIMGSGSARVTGGAACKVRKVGSGSIACS